MIKRFFPIVVERAGPGYMAYCPTLTGCFGSGISYEETLASVKEAIIKQSGKLTAMGSPIPDAGIPSLTIMEVDL